MAKKLGETNQIALSRRLSRVGADGPVEIENPIRLAENTIHTSSIENLKILEKRSKIVKRIDYALLGISR